MGSNKKKIFVEALTFGTAMCGGGTTVHHTPLLNILCICGEQPPAVLRIEDCTTHMVDRGTKNVSYIADLFWGAIEQVDIDGTLLTCVYFDEAKNVQKVGDVITAAYPRAFSFHGGEHVMSLFFSNIAQIVQIRVGNILFYLVSIWTLLI